MDIDEIEVMDIDEIEAAGQIDLSDLGESFLQNFCKKAATSFFEEFGLVSHQLNSYNFFIEHGLQKVFESFGEMLVEPSFDPTKNKDHEWRYATVKFGEVTVEKPTFYSDDKELEFLPWHARLQNMTYSARMRVNVQVEVFIKNVVKSDKFKTGQDEYVEKKILDVKTQDLPIGRIPVMVKSVLCQTAAKGKNGENNKKGDCAFDHGGYFVIKGAEKVFIAQEQMCTKRLWISSSPWTVSYRSETKRNRFIVRLAENQISEDCKRREKVLTVYFLSTEIPVWVLFFALGVSSDREVIDLIAFDGADASINNSLKASNYEADAVCEKFREGRNALAYVEEQIKSTKFPPGESVDDCLRLYLFPGLKGLKQKARFLGYMVKCLLSAFAGKRKCENRDSFRNKRIELAGELLEREIRVHLAHARRTMTKAMQRHLTGEGDLKPIERYLDASIITNGLSRAFSTGAWSHPFRNMERVSGVVANLGRANPLQTLIDLRRTRQQVLYTGKVGDARYPHPSHWGKVCFLSTPDGENCGLVKNMSLLGLVSTQILEPVVEKLYDCGMEELVDDTSTPLFGKQKVLLNGDWVGLCSDSESFVAEVKSSRRQSELPRQIEIKRDKDDKEVRIFTDAGRLLRPLLVVENLHKLKEDKPSQYTFEHLLDQGILELIGMEEEEDCTTAWGIKQLLKEPKNYTHCELDLSFLLGVSCAIVPFANHDHGRRVLYQSQKHCQQAIGFSSTNPNIRCDTLSQQLFYPQKPIFKTLASECLPKEMLFNGQNAIVAVNVHLGYNQEDSIVMNKASLERGMFRSEQIRSFKAEVDSRDSEKRKKMDELVQFGKTHSKIGRVDSLDDDGFPFLGANMHNGDIVIGKCTESGTDHSVKLKHTERGIVQKVVLSSNDDGKNFAAVSLRQVRSPCLGDKFSSMHGQKGVLGYLEEQENFPFTIQGIVPDIVINPHAFPSRQTPGQLLEAALSKGIACPIQKKKGSSDAYTKLIRHATPFSTPSVSEITEQLHRAGFSRWGNERVYNGRSGEMMRSLIFMGPTFYQRLVHMSEDKVKFRNTGPVHPLTRQPVADRKRFGGIKFGEMERDCLIAHGASANLHERLFTLSDSSKMHICRKCQTVANVIERTVSSGKKIRGPYCRLCESSDHVVRVLVPYGAKLLCQELFSMGISLNFDTRLC
ncbi:nuclear rna polymerase d2a [Arabis alpina]|uniref:DNA-directed RNA polymerase subunit beta n=1 Tax=Arabis alpina TaxID=50452 RepID=A0A087HQ68_ARAAL|nr:nuclear rna polymerase d2a [Arabis alpina]